MVEIHTVLLVWYRLDVDFVSILHSGCSFPYDNVVRSAGINGCVESCVGFLVDVVANYMDHYILGNG